MRWIPFIIGASALLIGCADPCVDDGLNQKDCPQNETESGSATDGPGTNTDSQTAGSTEPTTVGTDSQGGMDCPVFQDVLTSQTPTIVLLVDQSGSMTAAFDTVNRWEAIGATLFDPMTGVVPPLEGSIRFGLSLYTGPEEGMGGMCPQLTESAPKLDNYMDMKAVFDMSMPLDETPTGDALSVVAAALAANNEPGPKQIVLATDGEPDTCAQPNPQTGQDEAIAAAEAAYAMGIETSIISVGADVSAQHLQDMANAGAGVNPGEPDAPYYQALDQQSLIDAFNQIINGDRDCQFPIMEKVKPDQAGKCTVSVNMSDVPYGDPNGWQLNDPSEIELVGSACDSIQEGEVTIVMTCECEALE